MFMHFPYICTSFHIFFLLWTVLELFWLYLSFPSLFLFMLVVFMAPKGKSTPARNPLHSGASSFSDYAPLSLSGFVMMMPTRHFWRTFLDEAFIWNAESFWVILLTPTFPLSFIVRNGSLFVMSPSLVVLCWFKSSTPTCTELTIPYLISLLVSEVFLFLSHRSLLWICLGFLE